MLKLELPVGRCCIVIHSCCFHCASRFPTLTLAHSFNSLVRVSRRVVCAYRSRQHALASSPKPSKSFTLAEASIRHTKSKWCQVAAESKPSAGGSRTAASPLAISGILTLLSKCFSTFPHGTCLLSISRHYVAVDGGYHPFCALLPKSVTQ
jgi:hypothetical protein